MNHLKKNLKHLRTKSGKTQTGLASELGKSYTAIGNWEQGLAEPSVELLVKISRIYGIPIDDLILKDLQKGDLMAEKGGKIEVPKNRQKGDLKGDLMGDLITKSGGILGNPDTQTESLNEQEELTMWVVLKELRQNTAKLDQLLNLVEKTAQKKPSKGPG